MDVDELSLKLAGETTEFAEVFIKVNGIVKPIGTYERDQYYAKPEDTKASTRIILSDETL